MFSTLSRNAKHRKERKREKCPRKTSFGNIRKLLIHFFLFPEALFSCADKFLNLCEPKFECRMGKEEKLQLTKKCDYFTLAFKAAKENREFS
jgi:hypothetical protein